MSSTMYALLLRVFCFAVPKKEGANTEQLFQTFGPHQHGVAQSLPGTVGLVVHMYVFLTMHGTATT